MTSFARIALRAGVLAALVLSLLPRAALAQPGVVLDGRPDEWDAARTVFVRQGHGGPGARHDDPAPRYAGIERVKVRHDAGAVYFALALNGEFALQGMPGTLALLLDEDADSATGWEWYGMRGVDAAIEFSAVLGKDGTRMGTGLRLMHSEGRASCVGTANVAGVMMAPSHASRWFEVRIPRDGPISFGRRMRARLVSLDSADHVVGETGVFTVDLADARGRPTPRGAGAADPLARAPGTDFRAVSWNVGRETIFRRPDAYGALLRALDPDLLVLDEVAGGHSAREVEALLERILPGAEPWHAVYGTSGGSQRGVIAARGAVPQMASSFMSRLPYPDSARDVIGDDTTRAARDWLRSRLDASVPATGATVQIGGRRLLAVTVDLESAGVPGSPRDRLRRIEALRIRDAVTAAVRAGGLDGVLVAGDLNLVASPDPLDILAAGPDVDGSALLVPLPLRLDGASAATWENPEEPFTPGRLDFVLVGDAALAVAGGFVFRAGDLSPEWRERYGLAADASAVTDHLPVVTDLRWVDRGR
jgi:endonuclease/exonuclease/phosphatase family metal-dependent hydrolase